MIQSVRKGWQSLLFLGIGAGVALLGSAAFHALLPQGPSMDHKALERAIAEVLASATPPPALSAQVFSVIQPSLVLIEAANAEETGLGSGVIVSDDGAILTSLHVVQGATSIDVTFADGTTASAFIAGSQPENDIAVIQPDRLPNPLIPAVLGNPGSLREGDEAFVVGNPLGLYGSMSSGVISGFNRAFRPEMSNRTIRGLIQIDAAVNPGNSGGPLLNRYGEVVGIIAGIANPTKQSVFIGIGFAVPINVAARAAGSLPY